MRYARTEAKSSVSGNSTEGLRSTSDSLFRLRKVREAVVGRGQRRETYGRCRRAPALLQYALLGRCRDQAEMLRYAVVARRRQTWAPAARPAVGAACCRVPARAR
eukprot:6186037-Pleurochrysis_carterae.AAC.8